MIEALIKVIAPSIASRLKRFVCTLDSMKTGWISVSFGTMGLQC